LYSKEHLHCSTVFGSRLGTSSHLGHGSASLSSSKARNSNEMLLTTRPNLGKEGFSLFAGAL
jgi:hypothetical protein